MPHRTRALGSRGRVVALLIGVATLLTSLGLLGATEVAAQDRRVAVLPLEAGPGQGGRRIEGRVVEALTSLGYQVTSPNDIREFGVDVEDTSALVANLGVQALVGGRVRGRGNRRRLELWVKDAQGEQRGEMSARVRGTRPSAEQIAEALGPSLASVMEASASAAGSSSGAGGSGASSSAAGAQGGGAQPGSEEGAEEEEEEAARSAGGEQGEEHVFVLRALAGGGLRTRDARILTADGTGAGYGAGPYLDLGLRLEMILFGHLVVRGAFGSSVGLLSEDRVSGGEQDATFMRAFGDIGGSLWLERVSEIGLSFGVGWDRYELPLNDLLPGSEYLFLRPAIFTSVKIYRDLLVISGEMGVRIPLTVGELESVYGVDRDALGLDVAVRVGGTFDFGLTYLVEWSYRQYRLTFHQPAGDAEISDGGHRVSLMLGYSLSL